MAEPLSINQFETGIGDSPHLGFGVMRNVNIDASPGAITVSGAATSLFHTAYSATFTGATSDICTAAAGSVPASRTAVKPTTTGTLPAGLTANTVYFIINLSDTTFKLATTITLADAGTAVDITDTGSGTHTITTVNPGTINHIIKDPRTDDHFFQDSNGRVWYGNSSGNGGKLKLLKNATLDNAVVGSAALTNAAGNGIVLFKQNDSGSTHWLLAFRNALIDIIDVYSDADKETPSWTNGWDFGGTASDSTLNSGAGSGNRHHAIVGQDDIVYFTDGRYIGTIKEASGSTFAPGTSSTYTGNDQALDTPTNEVLVHLEELGTKILAAGSRSNNIYPWDRISDSFDLPIKVPEFNVQRLKNVGNLVYVLAGKTGIIYSTQGTYVKEVKKLPENVVGDTLTTSVTWGGVDAYKGGLLFGASGGTSANRGMYLLYPDGRLVIENQPSSGAGNVTAINADSGLPYIGYASGADYTSTTKYSSLNAVVNSMWYRVATKTEKGTYSKLEVVTAKSATSGAQIRVGYRENISASFTTLTTYTADSSTIVFGPTDIGLTNIENIQAQVEFDDDVELVEVRLIP